MGGQRAADVIGSPAPVASVPFLPDGGMWITGVGAKCGRGWLGSVSPARATVRKVPGWRAGTGQLTESCPDLGAVGPPAGRAQRTFACAGHLARHRRCGRWVVGGCPDSRLLGASTFHDRRGHRPDGPAARRARHS